MQPIPPRKGEDGPIEPSCFLAIPRSKDRRVEWAVRDAVRKAGFEPVLREDARTRFLTPDEQLAQVDCVVADVTEQSPSVFYEIGLARAMGKGLFLFGQSGTSIPRDLSSYVFLEYDKTNLSRLIDKLVASLEQFRRFPRRTPSLAGGSTSLPFPIDWDRLERLEAENLCRELLVQMGFRKVDWERGSRELDLVAELPRKDPDGYEYSELWLISMGRNAPIEIILEYAMEPRYLIHRMMRGEKRLSRLMDGDRNEASIIFLLIVLDSGVSKDKIAHIMSGEKKLSPPRDPVNFRIRIWDRDQLTALVQQFPQLAYKYFSDEGRSQSKYRKTPEELYQENVALGERQAKLIADLTEEKDRRIRAERDAVWKDISFSAAHKIGNPIFAIETNLDPLQKRVSESRPVEALDVISRIRISVEKAKGIVDQFKSLTRAQVIRPIPVLLKPVLEDSCRMPREHGVSCNVDCPEDLYLQADPERLSECFDELAANSMHWLDKPEKEIYIQVTQPAPSPLPGNLPSGEKFTLIRFTDNGSGVELDHKGKIFDAFFTTYEHGTGLGLALVRRIIEGHGGTVFETGIPGQGAEFEIYLPSVQQAAKPSKDRRRRRETKAVR